MRAKEILRILKADGWYELPRKATGHVQLKHPSKPGRVTISSHSGDIGADTLSSIWSQAKIKDPQRR
jgi:predicted RNA binding protein YcfA (HicA-like mRNA interferase family)